MAGPHQGVRARRGPSLVLPVVLITLGAILLLQNLGVLPRDIWGEVVRMWPLLLVLAGLELLLGGRLSGLPVAALLVAVAVLGVLSLGRWGAAPEADAGQTETRTLTQPLQGARQVAVTVRFGAGQLAVGALDPAGDELASMTFSGPSGLQPRVSYGVRNGVGELEYRMETHSGWNPLPWLRGQSQRSDMTVLVSPHVPLTMRVEAGAAETRIDLSVLRVSRFDLETGATRTWLRLPEAAGMTSARVAGGAADITIEVPAGVAAQIEYSGGASRLEIDEARFPSVGTRQYRSPDYATATNRVDLVLQVGAATVRVR